MNSIRQFIDLVNMLENLKWRAIAKLTTLLLVFVGFLFLLVRLGITKVTIGLG